MKGDTDRSGPTWTSEQRRGITTGGRGLLLSAAAGSGKTAVLAERCAHLIADSDPPSRIDQLLVVTFTEAAAAEMKSRIQQALHQRIQRGESPHLARQLALFDHAQVSTLHGFCSRLLRQHFHLLGLDPHFAILDADEATLMRGEVVRALFAEQYEHDESRLFQKLIDAYGEGNDERLMQQVIRTHDLLCSLIDPDEWRAEAMRRLREPSQTPLGQTALGRELHQRIELHLQGMLRRCSTAETLLTTLTGFEKYVQQVSELRRIIQHWQNTLAAHGPDALAEESAFELPRLPPTANSTPGKAIAKALIDSVREPMMKGGQLRALLRFTAHQWCDGLAAVVPHAQVLLNLVHEFSQRYGAAKRAARALDFADLERFAMQLLRDGNVSGLAPSAVARLCHRRFEHVLVDEYQDINEVQDAILMLVSRECLADEGRPSNLFCVGDVKQSIYRFRLAEPALFLQRQKRFRAGAASGGEVIDLQHNFRSRGPLLEAINSVIERLMTEEASEIEYDQTHRLRPGLTYPLPDGQRCFTGSPIELHVIEPADADPGEAHGDADAPDAAEDELERAEVEGVFLARRIREMMGHDGGRPVCVFEKHPGGGLRPRPIRYSDIVILLRALHHKADQYAEILRQHGIPVHSESGTGYFESMEVRDMLALLRLLDNQQQDIPLAAVLRSPMMRLPRPEDAMARVRLAFNRSVPFHEAVVQYARHRRDELAQQLQAILSRIGRWREMAQRRPLADLIWTIYQDTGYLAFAGGLDSGSQRTANLIHLHERARQFGRFQRQGLGRFLQFLDSLQNESDLGQPSVASQADDVVRIMSVHRSKGLEFPVVLLPDLGKRINLQDCRGPILVDRHAYLGMSVVDERLRVRYPSLASMLAEEQMVRQSLAEELRVLYVAMTRAREHLVLVGTCRAGTVEKWSGRWNGHTGAMPAEDVLSARCMLDWLGPVAAMLASSCRSVELHQHSADEVERLLEQARQPPDIRAANRDGKWLTPEDPAPPHDETAGQVIARLTYSYPHLSVAGLPATLSVTGWTKHALPAVVGYDGPSGAAEPFELLLDPPRAVAEVPRSTAADRGSATHLVLQHLDFSLDSSPDALRGQVEGLLARRLITPAQAALVDLATIEWLMNSEVGRLLRRRIDVLRRELQVNVAVRPNSVDAAAHSSDPLDQVMVRGRIDVLIPDPAGAVLIDYKTDRIDAARVAERVDFYRPQVALYRSAIEIITRQPVACTLLVFLDPKVIAEVSATA